MPGLNKKGPQGDGAMTGRAMGRCNPKGRLRNFLNTPDATQQNSDASEEQSFRGRGNSGMGRKSAGRGLRRRCRNKQD